MRENKIFSDAQAFAALDSTGVVSTNTFNLQLDASGGNTILTDDQVKGVLNVLITTTDVVIATDAGVEGIEIELRTDDAVALNTAKAASGAGYQVLAMVDIPLINIVAGYRTQVAIPAAKAKEFLGAWARAGATSFTGSVTLDIWLSNNPDGTENEDIQKMPSR